MTPCRTCGRDRYAPEPPERLASVRYVGRHPEPSISFPVPCPRLAVVPFDEAIANLTGGGSHRNEVVAMSNGRWIPRVSVWAAIYLAGARQRHGPWVQVRLTPPAWQEVQARASWLRKAHDAVLLMSQEFLEDFRSCEVKQYRIL